ncbi:MAG: hydrogenase maturation protease [Bacteroidales bacterium]|nr:hydrogenase maturation protease [Bacteroidales bacterium]MCF8327283.1 hydrogenase maturation protease [Bacteroidales bacterium]
MNKFIHNINEIDFENSLFVGMGNRIKSDDGVGIYISKELEKEKNLNVIIAENSIENYLGKINKQNAHRIIFIDAVDFGERPGYSHFLQVDELTDTTTNTHNLSLHTISRFIQSPLKWIIGIQASDVSFGIGLSQQVKKTADKIVKLLKNNSITNHKTLEL